ncbi:MAG: C25 family cysteine peptidase [Promethearchaeota archaeon]
MTIKKSLLLVLTILLMSSVASLCKFEPKTQKVDVSSDLLNLAASNEDVDYLIITTESFKTLLEPLAKWKTQKGVISKIEVTTDITLQYSGADLTEKIKNCIINYHNNNKTKWVLLAGDVNHVPTEYIFCDDGFPYDGYYVCCDSYYGDMDNDWTSTNFDFNSEVYVGRLTANSQNEMEILVENILNYEKNPPIGPWMSHALFASSILQFDQDWNNDGIVDYGECDGNRFNNFVNESLIPESWTSVFLAQTQGVKGSSYHSDLQLNYNNLQSEINKGCSIGTIFAHGNPQQMGIDRWDVDYDGDMLFDYTANPFESGGVAIDVGTHTNLMDTSYMYFHPQDDKLGMYYMGSCSVGTFDDASDCIAEYFLKNTAIGCVAGSYVVWGEDQWYERSHGGWFIEGLGFRFWEQLFQFNQPGKALALAKADYASDRITYPESIIYTEWSNKTLKQYNLLGDPEIPIWLSIPQQLNVSVEQPFNNNTNTMTLKAIANNIPVENVTITYTFDNNLIWKGTTNETGMVDVPFSDIEVGNNVFTASKNGYLPFQANLPQGTDNVSSIIGYDFFYIAIIIVGFIGISSIHYKRSHLEKNYK